MAGKEQIKICVIGQETTGPGGFVKALQAAPVILSVARDIGETAAWRLLDQLHQSGRSHKGSAQPAQRCASYSFLRLAHRMDRPQFFSEVQG